MQTKILVLLFILIASNSYFGQIENPFTNIDVPYSDLEFDSDMEKNWFTKYENKEEIDTLEFFYDINRTSDEVTLKKFKNEVKTICDQHREIDAEGKKFEKEIKKLFDAVHKHFLVQYVEDADFNDLINDGKYNCLSGTVLYAIILDNLNIPFEIKEGYFHIYMVVSPGDRNITIESTSPADGVYYLSKAQRQEYVKILIENKLIAPEDANLEEKEILSKYSSTDPSISLNKLLAYQYYNIGVRTFKQTEFEVSTANLTKASYLCSDELINSMLAASLFSQFPLIKFIREKHLKPIITLFNYSDSTVIDDFDMITSKIFDQYIQDNFYEDFVLVYDEMMSKITYQEYKDLLKCKHANALSYFLFQQKKYDEIIENLTFFYTCDSTDRERTLKGIEEAFVYKFDDYQDFLSLKEELDRKIKEYPVVLESNVICRMYLEIVLIISGDYYRIDNNTKGREYLDLFREKAQEFGMDKLKSEQIGYGYGEAAAYEIRYGSMKKAKEIINEGLEFDPFDYTLNKKLKIIKESGY